MAEKRTCGECTLCCKLLSIPEIEKPQGEWCKHCAVGEGCKIYDQRPDSCRVFDCLWLQGTVPEDLKPNRCKVVFGCTKDGSRIVAYVDPTYPDAHKKDKVNAFIEHIRSKRIEVIVVCGDKRTLLF